MALITFPLIWVGGLVTTYDAGMAVPDWPGTYGYNLFLYPLSTWWSGPWDLFIEHGHRLLGALVGVVTIVFVIVTYYQDDRRWMTRLALLALLLVILQGSLGGIRVLAFETQVAKVHGCIGPAFFASCCSLVVLTSPRWRSLTLFSDTETNRPVLAVRRVAFITLALAYIQLILGANLRHFAVDMSPAAFRSLVIFHVVVAFLVVLHAFIILYTAHRAKAVAPWLGIWAILIVLLVVTQFFFGVGTWIVKYGWPAILPVPLMAEGYVPVAKSFVQANIVTAHVAIGSMLLGLLAILYALTWRVLPESSGAESPELV